MQGQDKKQKHDLGKASFHLFASAEWPEKPTIDFAETSKSCTSAGFSGI